MAKITVVIDLDDLELDIDRDESYTVSEVLKETIMSEVRQELRKIAISQVNEVFGVGVKSLLIQELKDYLIANFKNIAENIKVKGTLSHELVSIEEYIKTYFSMWESTIDKSIDNVFKDKFSSLQYDMKKVAENKANEMRKVYDMSFATEIVKNLIEYKMIDKDVVSRVLPPSS